MPPGIIAGPGVRGEPSGRGRHADDTASYPQDGARGLIVAPALLSLTYAPLYDRPVGFHVHELVWVLGVMFGAGRIQALRERRDRLEHAVWLRLALVGALLFAGGGFAVSEALTTPPGFIAVAPTLARGVLGFTLLGQVAVSWRRRTRWREAVETSA